MLKILNKKSLFDRPVDKENIVKLLERKNTLKFSLLADTMFKAMFQNESRKKYSCKFLSLLFEIDYDYLLNNLKLSKNETSKKLESDKGERCDYVASIDGIMTNIEVNNNSSIETMEKNIEYATRIYSEKVKAGEEYEYTPTVQININNFAFKGNDKTIDTYYIMNENGEILTKKLQFILIYVPNIYKKWYTKGVEALSELERYILVMAEQDIEKAQILGKDNDFMNEYLNESIDVLRYSYLGEAYDKEWALKDEAFRDGVNEGMERGIEQNSIEIAKKLIKQGIDVGIISSVTSLSLEKINNLKLES